MTLMNPILPTQSRNPAEPAISHLDELD